MNSINCLRCQALNYIKRQMCFQCGAQLSSTTNYARPGRTKKIVIVLGFMAIIITTTLGFMGYFGWNYFFAPDFQNLTADSNSDKNSVRGEEIWHRFLEASGENNPQVKTLSMKGKLEIYLNNPPPGITKTVARGDFEYYFKAPDKFYAKLQINTPKLPNKSATLTIVQKVINGDKGQEQKTELQKTTDLPGESFTGLRNDSTKELTAEEIKELQDEVLRKYFTEFSNFSFRGETTDDQQEKVFILSARDKKGKEFSLFINQQSFLLSTVNFPNLVFETGSNINEFLEKKQKHIRAMSLTKYQLVSGQQIPYQFTARGFDLSTKMDLSEVLMNIELDDSRFEIKPVELPKPANKTF
jgi:hypothetical protein